jgi:hypothetical protein
MKRRAESNPARVFDDAGGKDVRRFRHSEIFCFVDRQIGNTDERNYEVVGLGACRDVRDIWGWRGAGCFALSIM